MKTPLDCWAFRAQRRHGAGREVEERAKELTSQLAKAGIKSTAELKFQIGIHGKTGASVEDLDLPGSSALALESVNAFLETNQIGCRRVHMKASTAESSPGQAQSALAQAVRQVRSKAAHDETPQ